MRRTWSDRLSAGPSARSENTAVSSNTGIRKRECMGYEVVVKPIARPPLMSTLGSLKRDLAGQNTIRFCSVHRAPQCMFHAI